MLKRTEVDSFRSKLRESQHGKHEKDGPFGFVQVSQGLIHVTDDLDNN